MPRAHEIRADYDRASIVVYQAYSPAIAAAALEAQRFVPPFSFNRMTWIKPSFLWLMHRSNWGPKKKPGQERTLAVRISREGWEEALSLAVHTSPVSSVYPDSDTWRAIFRQARVHVQWDPERSLRGAALPYRSIQIGVSRQLIRRFAEDWIVRIEDLSPLVVKIRNLLRSRQAEQARRFPPPERVYPVPADLARRLQIQP